MDVLLLCAREVPHPWFWLDRHPWDWTCLCCAPVSFWCPLHSTSIDLESTNPNEVSRSTQFVCWSRLTSASPWNLCFVMYDHPCELQCLCSTSSQSGRILWQQVHNSKGFPSKLDRDRCSGKVWLSVRSSWHRLGWRESVATDWQVPHRRHPPTQSRHWHKFVTSRPHPFEQFGLWLANRFPTSPRIPPLTPWWRTLWVHYHSAMWWDGVPPTVSIPQQFEWVVHRTVPIQICHIRNWTDGRKPWCALFDVSTSTERMTRDSSIYGKRCPSQPFLCVSSLFPNRSGSG